MSCAKFTEGPLRPAYLAMFAMVRPVTERLIAEGVGLERAGFVAYELVRTVLSLADVSGCSFDDFLAWENDGSEAGG